LGSSPIRFSSRAQARHGWVFCTVWSTAEALPGGPIRETKKTGWGGVAFPIRGPMLAGNSGGIVAECEPKKGGRSKGKQTVPLIFAQNRPKVVREYTLEASTAQLIEDYASWAAESSGISSDEARMLLIGRSVDAFIRKDVLYRNHIQDQKGTK
jgi:hypothetical protein